MYTVLDNTLASGARGVGGRGGQPTVGWGEGPLLGVEITTFTFKIVYF